MRKKILIGVLLLGLSALSFASCEVTDPLTEPLYTNHIYPSATNTYDVGSVALQYRNGYFQNLFVGGGPAVSGTPPSTDHAVARYDGVTGLLIQDSPGVTIDDFDNLTVDNDIDTVTGDINSGNNVNVTNDLDVTDDADIGGSLDVVDDVTVGGTTILGAGVPLISPFSGGLYAFSNISSEAAFIGAATVWRGGLWIGEDVLIDIEHTSVGDFDLTGGAFENLFTSDDAIFTQVDADIENFIILTSGIHAGGIAGIERFIDATHVVVNTFGWDADIANIDFVITPHPNLVVGNSSKTDINVNGGGLVHFVSDGYTRPAPMFEVELDAAVDGTAGMMVEVEANGYAGIESIVVDYKTGDMQPNDHASVIKIELDDTGATNSDTTTEIDFINILTLDEEDVEKHAVHIGQGFDSAITVSGGVAEDPDYGYEVTPDVPTDRVNGVAPDGTAFLQVSASDLQIFDADNDYILIGSDAIYEAIEAILVAGANKHINETYEYSTGAGTWATLVVSNTVNGFQQSGIITFNAPVGWAKSNLTTGGGAAITDAYYVRITRTRNALGSPPIEDYFKTFTASSLTDFEIRGDGTIRPVAMADAAAPNHSLYFSTTQNKLVYKDGGGVVHDLW